MEQCIIVIATILFLILPIPISLIIGVILLTVVWVHGQQRKIWQIPSIVWGAAGVVFAIAGVAILAQGNQNLRIALASWYLMITAFMYFLRSISGSKSPVCAVIDANPVVDEQQTRHAVELFINIEQPSLGLDKNSLENILQGMRSDIRNIMQYEADMLSQKIIGRMDAVMESYSEYKSSQEIEKIVRAEREKLACQFADGIRRIKEKHAIQIENTRKEQERLFNMQLQAIRDKAKMTYCQEMESGLRVEFEERLQQSIAEIDTEKTVQIEELQRLYENEIDKSNQLNRVIEDLQRTHQELGESLSAETNAMLVNKKIVEAFDRALWEAKTELDIMSPWMNQHVVDELMIDRFRRLLERGVTIKILYGMEEHCGKDKSISKGTIANKTKKTLKELKRNLDKYPNFITQQGNTHGKLFICDDAFYVISSFNILSYDGEGTRGEIGEISQNQKNIKRYRKQFFDFV